MLDSFSDSSLLTSTNFQKLTVLPSSSRNMQPALWEPTDAVCFFSHD